MRSIIIGAGTYGEVYLSYLQSEGINVIGFIDDNPQLKGTKVKNIPVIGTRSDIPQLINEYTIEAAYCPIGNNELRVSILRSMKNLGLQTPSYIHNSCIISPDVQIGDSVYILPHTVIMPFVQIDDFVMISVGAKIIHHTRLSQGAFVSNGVNLGASINVEDFAYIGMGATIMTGVKTLAKSCLIGAGAVVIRDVPEKAIVAGNPAKVLRYKE